jgi:uncharacterized iron-regulated protein
MRLFIFILCSFSVLFSINAVDKVYDLKSQKFLPQSEWLEALPETGQIVLGEYHYNGEIQQAQGRIIDLVVQSKKKEGRFSVAWEFLNYPDQEKIQESFLSFSQNEISGKDFIHQFFKPGPDEEESSSVVYLPFIEATKRHGGQFVGVNAPRSWKSVITKTGLSSLDPSLVPPIMELGSRFYFERFEEAMGGHVSSEKLFRYYEAQCYTDSVMAWAMDEYMLHDLRFLVVGAFHSDYLDGVSLQLAKHSSLSTTTIKIVDATELSANELLELLQAHAQYGDIADYLYIVQGPEQVDEAAQP